MKEEKFTKIGDLKPKALNPTANSKFTSEIESIITSNPMGIDLYVFEKIQTKEEFKTAFEFILNNLNNKKYQPYLGKMLDAIGQNGQMIGAKEWFLGMDKIFSETCPASVREHALSSSNYLLSFYPTFSEELLNGISIENVENYSKTGKYLKFIFYLSKYSQDWSFSEHLTGDIKEKLSKFTEKNPDNNYLLSKFSQGVLDGIEHKSHPRSSELPFFKINSKDQYGAVYEDGMLHISDPKDSEEISEKIKSIQELSSLIGKVDIRQLRREALEIKNVIENLVAKNTIQPGSLGIKNIRQDNERVDGLYKDYLFLLDGIMRPIIEEDFGDSIFTMPIKEQAYFLSYAKDLKVREIYPIKNFSKSYGVDGFRTFLSLEHGGKEMGDKILTLGEKLPEESGKVLFKTYGDMVDASEEVGDLLIENLGEKATPELVNQTKESLLIGGKKLLERYADKASTCEGVDCKNLGKELEEHLSLAKASVFAFSYACKTLVERGEFSFEDFKKAKLSYDKSPIPEKMREEIIAMHKENTKQYPEGLRDYWRGTLREGLEKENPKQMVVSVEYEGNVTTAMRVIEQEDGSWYGASFNVNPTVMGSRIGSELLKKVIEDLAKDKPFVADCYAENPMLKTYIEKFGFQITSTDENYQNTGVKVYKITLFPKKEEVSSR